MYCSHIMPYAVAKITGGEEFPQISGTIKFYQKRGYSQVEINVNGLPMTDTGFFGFHIHEGASCLGDGFSDTKGHFNPKSSPHPSHAGDLPPLISCLGGAHQTVATDRFRVKDIIGRTVVIHSGPDDFTSQPSGNAGTKIACGEIKRV